MTWVCCSPLNEPHLMKCNLIVNLIILTNLKSKKVKKTCLLVKYQVYRLYSISRKLHFYLKVIVLYTSWLAKLREKALVLWRSNWSFCIHSLFLLLREILLRLYERTVAMILWKTKLYTSSLFPCTNFVIICRKIRKRFWICIYLFDCIQVLEGS